LNQRVQTTLDSGQLAQSRGWRGVMDSDGW
jgi:hypothetical protein